MSKNKTKYTQEYNKKNYARIDMKIRPEDKQMLLDGARKLNMSVTSFVLYMCSPEKQERAWAKREAEKSDENTDELSKRIADAKEGRNMHEHELIEDE